MPSAILLIESTHMSEPASDAFGGEFERDIDEIVDRIVSRVMPAEHASGVLLLCATRILGHLAGHLDNVRAAKGLERLGADASMHEAYQLVDLGRPPLN